MRSMLAIHSWHSENQWLVNCEYTWNRTTGFQNLVWMARYQFSLNRLWSVSGWKASHHHMWRVIHHTSSSSSCDYVTRIGWGTRRIGLDVDSWEVNQWNGSLFMDMIRVDGWWIMNCSVVTNDSVLFWEDRRMDRETPLNTDRINGSFIVLWERAIQDISLDSLIWFTVILNSLITIHWDEETGWDESVRRSRSCFWWMIREQQHRMMRREKKDYLKIEGNRCTRSTNNHRIQFHRRLIEGYLFQSIHKSSLSRITEPIHLKFHSSPLNEVSEGRSDRSSIQSIALFIVNVFLKLKGGLLIVFRSSR